MKGVASLFSDEAREALQVQLGIVLSDETDYTRDELSEMYDRVTDNFPYAYDEDGAPEQLGRVFEEIVDTFIGKSLVDFSH